MKAHLAVVAAFSVAVTLASVAAGSGPTPRSSELRSSSKLQPEQTFVLTPFKAGALKRDSGRGLSIVSDNGRDVMRGGQEVTIHQGTLTLEGKRGTLTIRERNEWVAVSNENALGFAFPPGVAIGTWKVVRGTGQYAQVTGGGRQRHMQGSGTRGSRDTRAS